MQGSAVCVVRPFLDSLCFQVRRVSIMMMKIDVNAWR